MRRPPDEAFSMTRAAWLAFLLTAAMPAAAVEIDGHLAPGEWDGARHITDFVLVQPMTGAPATWRTEAWVLATPEGLAVAFRNEQPPEVPRTTQRTRRDQGGQLDRINVMVDFDGDGRTGYDLMVTNVGDVSDEVITNERNFSTDWDGVWQHAARQEADAWYVELLIPWHVAPMARPEGGVRTIGLYLDRVVGSTGERFGWPDISFQRPTFLSQFAKVEVPHFEQSLLAVTPYVVASQDFVGDRADFDAGADLFWKPNGSFQLAATLNPDFGQVESDALVVNFGAVETFFGDKRPFFTENQGLFDFGFGVGNSRLLYTRRIGGNADDGSGAADVRAAIKLNGSLGATRYGVLAASEGDDAGRDFLALRATRDFGAHDLGGMLTRVDRPFLDRSASVYAIDDRWVPAPGWNVASALVLSRIEQAGTTTGDSGFQTRIDWEMGEGRRQQLYFLHLGDQLQLDDFGYLDRNDFNYLRYEFAQRRTGLPESSPFASHEWRWAASQRRNDHGLLIANAVAVNRVSERRDGGSEFFDIGVWSRGHDDRITRGNGVVRVPEKVFLFWERSRPRRGHWSLYGWASANAEGLDGISGMGLELGFEPTLHISDTLSLRGEFALQRIPDWLLWRGGNLLGSYDAEFARIGANLQWRIGDRQELRVRFETIALDARAEQAWRVAGDGRPLASNDPLSDFSLAQMGLQIRWRYELAPLSDLYIVYGRGGFTEQADSRSLAQLLGDATDLRDADQILIKLSYRFSN
ncbi:DUF5916 domain-containing protein [Arenimonas composti]|nr:DUF5916 domain-containing protein [Arenimonas composti]